MKGMKLIFIVLLSLPLLFAASGVSALGSALNGLCSGLTSMLPVAAMLMTVLGAVIYASGQMMGAETRARATVWTTAAVTGAMMSILITVIAPSVLGAVYGGTITCSGGSLTPPAPTKIIGNNVICDQDLGCICRQVNCVDTVCNREETCHRCIVAGGPMTCTIVLPG